MSPTPRTDKETRDTLGGAPGVLNATSIRRPDGSGLYVPAEFARKLERELAELKERSK